MFDKLREEFSLDGNMAEFSTKIAYATIIGGAIARMYDAHLEDTRELEIYEYDGACDQCGIEGGCFCPVQEIV